MNFRLYAESVMTGFRGTLSQLRMNFVAYQVNAYMNNVARKILKNINIVFMLSALKRL